ncbi:hybrid sensor histidine kinase/response regulator [Nostoc parmelioides]|uniref:histidine kinase n=1 Tax=Nostoc parmelioides FACHB-3921 TaxID=2692909 RepID=A0ABR8BQ97_9NOSO|nr:response regulator [Nostoc parmelioides]MBD2255457.1 response regulator [Nostoc parmelioides FACHB-3921]
MLPEQQQRILGYFIEEARDHLNTIEQGLLNLESTLNDPEMINEVFRAAHSIKGGAAMLGLTSIQHTSHRLEDCFKILKDNPIQVDQKLESLFLGVSDTLKALLEQLSGPFGLSEEVANTLMSETEPVFQWLHEHLEQLVQKGGTAEIGDYTVSKPNTADSVGTLTEIFFRQDVATPAEATPKTSPVLPTYSPVVATDSDQWSEFQAQVLQTLREMLQLFKQPATPASRQNLQDCCNQLVKLGKTWNLPNWCNLCKAAANAIANQENTYLTLAKIVITEIKQAQELVLRSRESEITISHRLEALWGFPEMPLLEVAQNLLGDVPTAVSQSFITPITPTSEPTITNNEISTPLMESPTDSVTSLTEISDQLAPQSLIAESIANTGILFDHDDQTAHTTNKIHTHGPEVGIAELNTLADLFEGDTPELDETWQQEEIIDINSSSNSGVDVSKITDEEIDSDIADFLSLEEDKAESEITINNTEDLSLLFGENFLDKNNLESLDLFKAPVTAGEIIQENQYDANQLPDSDDVIDDLLSLRIDDEIRDSNELGQTRNSSDFDDLFLDTDTNTESLEETKPPTNSEPQLITLPEDLSLNNLFNDLEENTELSTDKSEVSDLLDLPPADNLGTLWNSATEVEPEQILESVIEEDIAQALEESLFEAAASGDIFVEKQQFKSSLNESLDPDDLNITFLQDEQQLDLLFVSDTDDDLFGEFTTNTHDDHGIDIISDDIQFLREISQVSPPEIHDFSQQPEVLDFTPEFTTQIQELSAVTGSEIDLFSQINENISSPVIESRETLEDSNLFTTASALDVQPSEIIFEISSSNVDLKDITFEETNDSSSLEIVAETSGLDLGDDLSTLTHDLADITFAQTNDFSGLETVIEFAAPAVAETNELELDDDLSALTSDLTDITFEETNDSSGLKTVAETGGLDLGDDLSALTSDLTDITFEETNDSSSLEIVAETSGLDLGDDLSTLTNDLADITFAQTNDFSGLETVIEFAAPAVTETSELELDDDLSALTSDLTDITFEETNDSSGLETVVETGGLGLDDDLSALTSDLTDITFEEINDSSGLEIVVETGGLGLDDDLSALTSDLTDITFEETNDSSGLETVVETGGLGLDDDLSALTSNLTDITFEEINDSSSLETVAETGGLDLDDDLSALTSDELITENRNFTDIGVEDINLSTSESSELGLELTNDENPEDIVDSSEFVADITPPTADVTGVELENVVSTPVDIPESVKSDADIQDDFADLEALLEIEEATPDADNDSIAGDDFAALEALLGEDNPETVLDEPPAVAKIIKTNPTVPVTPAPLGDEFSDLEKLLAEADQTISHSSPVKPTVGKTPRTSNRRTARFEETMKVPVKQLDEMSNLVGELVVNRNTLEQDHERLRQSLDNLLIQVQQLSDVGARMQELYEQSLLEASLLASRKTREPVYEVRDANSDRGFTSIELDSFTPFHTLSQEMIELIVRVRESASDIDFVTEETERVARQFRQVTTQLQEGLTRARMVPFSQTIDRLRRGVRDNAIKFGKQVELVIEGGDTLIDKMILDHLNDPLTHMLNNAIAHGIETPEIREAAGKPAVGTITIRAFHQGNQTVISVGDDGAGIDPERIKAKAVKLGIMTPEQARTISRLEIYDLLFQSGFSTKDEADEIAGRGVGMDVVRSEISEIRGAVNTDSTVGKGTTFTIRLPLTLSICKALCCVSDKARIAFSMDGVEDTLDIPSKNVQNNADGQSFISWRDTVLPFRPLKDLLTFNRQLGRGNVYGGTRDDDMISVVVVRSGNTLIALQIDQVLSEQEIVIKQFEGPAPKPIGVAGATVLGDGRIMPIADVLEIIDIFQGRMSKHAGGAPWQQTPPIAIEIPAVKIDPTVLIVDDSITVRELLSLTFNKAGYRVEQARDGQEAWDKLRSGLPCDIVFCDIEMPRCDGLELLSRIQKDSTLNHLPIAMLTSRGADKHRQMAIQLGASGYFTKPYLEEALLEAAVRMLKGEKLVSQGNA